MTNAPEGELVASSSCSRSLMAVRGLEFHVGRLPVGDLASYAIVECDAVSLPMPASQQARGLSEPRPELAE